MSESGKYLPKRRCIACGEIKAQSELIRFTRTEGLKADEGKKAPGRGTYLCNNPECISKALKKNAFARSYRTQIPKCELEEIERYLNAK